VNKTPHRAHLPLTERGRHSAVLVVMGDDTEHKIDRFSCGRGVKSQPSWLLGVLQYNYTHLLI